MAMDTFSLLDDERQAVLRDDLTLHEMYKTRLVRVDQPSRGRQDPLQRKIHQFLRNLRYRKISKQTEGDAENLRRPKNGQGWSTQNTSLIADVVSRFILAIVIGIFLTVPLASLADEQRKGVQLAVIAVCIVAFASLVSVALKASNLEMMIVTAGYAAIISVFVSNDRDGN